MASRKTRAEIAQQTVEILERGWYTLPDGTIVSLGDSVRQSVQGSRHYAPGDFGDVFARRDKLLAGSPNPGPPRFEVYAGCCSKACGMSAARRCRLPEFRIRQESRWWLSQRQSGPGGKPGEGQRTVRLHFAGDRLLRLEPQLPVLPVHRQHDLLASGAREPRNPHMPEEKKIKDMGGPQRTDGQQSGGYRGPRRSRASALLRGVHAMLLHPQRG